jgi:hypothetical protein
MGAKYVRLTVRDADGDTDSSKQSFVVGAATTTTTTTAKAVARTTAGWTGARLTPWLVQ